MKKVFRFIAGLAPFLTFVNCIWLILGRGEPIFYFTISAWATCVAYAFEDIFMEANKNRRLLEHPLILASLWGFIATMHMSMLSW